MIVSISNIKTENNIFTCTIGDNPVSFPYKVRGEGFIVLNAGFWELIYRPTNSSLGCIHPEKELTYKDGTFKELFVEFLELQSESLDDVYMIMKSGENDSMDSVLDKIDTELNGRVLPCSVYFGDWTDGMTYDEWLRIRLLLQCKSVISIILRDF